MDIVLLGITLVSLVVALVMSAAAWRVSRDERARSAARVAALSAAASGQEQAEWTSVKPIAPEVVTDRVAVSELRPAAPWTTSRVSTFATPGRVQTSGRAAARETELVMHPVFAEESVSSPVLAEGFLGSGSTSGHNDRQRGLAVAAVLLFAVVVSAGAWTMYGRQSVASSATVAVADGSPLELVSLRHERRGPRLAVTGLVRNPGAGGIVERLAAVVFLFDRDGAFISSARAPVDFLRLVPGDETPFVIDVEAPLTVARYRVSFRNDSGVVPHVDRRAQEPVAPNAVSQNAGANR
jgi:hypothetical protein